MNLYKILKNNFDTFFIFKVISIIGIITAASIILIMVFTTLGMWKESINIVPNEQNIIISETTKQSPLTARKIREWEQIEIVNKYWESINNLNADYSSKAVDIYQEILNDEKKNNMPDDIIKNSLKKFEERAEKIDWKKYYTDLPFNESALALYEWSPIAEELKTLDKKIVLNSMILKWDNVKKDFSTLISF